MTAEITDMPDMPTKIHQGKNVRRFRDMLQMKQEVLAKELEGLTGEEWNQKRISWLESKETIKPELLEQVAKALKVPAKAIENFTEEAAYNVIGNVVTTVNDHGTGQIFQFNPTINPIDKLLDQMEEIKQLNAALLKEKDEKIALLEKILSERK